MELLKWLGIVCVCAGWTYLRYVLYPSDMPQPRPLIWYLIWMPIGRADASKRDGRFLTTREWLGWAVVAVLIAVGMLISAHEGHR